MSSEYYEEPAELPPLKDNGPAEWRYQPDWKGGFTMVPKDIEPGSYEYYDPKTMKVLKTAQKQGRKDDDGKLPMELIPEEFLEAMAEVYKVGLKYGRENWKKGLSFRRMKGAMMRHMNDFYLGDDYDKGSPTQHHMAAVAFYAAAIIYFQSRDRKDLDDRDISRT